MGERSSKGWVDHLLGSLLSLALQVLHGNSLLTAQLAQPSLLCLQLCQYPPYLHPHTHPMTPPIPSISIAFCMCSFGGMAASMLHCFNRSKQLCLCVVHRPRTRVHVCWAAVILTVQRVREWCSCDLLPTKLLLSLQCNTSTNGLALVCCPGCSSSPCSA